MLPGAYERDYKISIKSRGGGSLYSFAKRIFLYRCTLRDYAGKVREREREREREGEREREPDVGARVEVQFSFHV